jgi:hypothetical protein
MPVNFTNQFSVTLDERFIIFIIFVNCYMTIGSINSSDNWIVRFMFLVIIEFRHHDDGKRGCRLSVFPPNKRQAPIYVFRSEEVGGKVRLAAA